MPAIGTAVKAVMADTSAEKTQCLQYASAAVLRQGCCADLGHRSTRNATKLVQTEET